MKDSRVAEDKHCLFLEFGETKEEVAYNSFESLVEVEGDWRDEESSVTEGVGISIVSYRFLNAAQLAKTKSFLKNLCKLLTLLISL